VGGDFKHSQGHNQKPKKQKLKKKRWETQNKGNTTEHQNKSQERDKICIYFCFPGKSQNKIESKAATILIYSTSSYKNLQNSNFENI